MAPRPIIGRFAAALPSLLHDYGGGLAQGKNWQQGLALGVQRGQQMQPYRDEQAQIQKADSERAATKTATLAWVEKEIAANPDNPTYRLVAEGLQMGNLDPAGAFNTILAAKAQPKPKDLMKVGAGESVFDPNSGESVYTGPQAPPDLGDQYSIESGMARDYGNTSAVKAYEEVRNGYEKVQQAAAQGSGAGDMSMIFGFMKMLDPGSTVREGEYATAQNTGGIPAAVVNLYNKALDGQFLTEAQRNDFLNTADGLYQETVGNLEPVNQQFSTRAGEYGVDPSRFLRVPETYQKPGGGISGKTSTGITFDFTPG